MTADRDKPALANAGKEKPADKESLFAQVTRMSQEKRAVSDRRAQARRVTEQVEISRQIAARTPLPKIKPVDNLKVAAAQLGPDGDGELELESELDDSDPESTEAPTPRKIDKSA